MAGRDIRAGGAFVEFSLRRKNLERGLRQVGQRITQFGARINQIGTQVAGIGAAITAPFAGAAAVFGRVGGSLEKLSQQTGIAVSELSQVTSAGQLAGVAFEDVAGSIEELQIRLGEAAQDGTGPLSEALKKLGLDARELSETPLPERLGLIADRLNALPNASDRQFLSDEIFGGDAFKIAPLLQQGSKGIDQFVAKAEKLGIVISDKSAKAAEKFNVAMRTLKLQVTAGAVAVGEALAPVLDKVSDFLSLAATSAIEFVKQNKTLVVAVASAGAGILALGGSLVGLGTAVGVAGFAVTSLAGLLAALTSPIALVIGGIAALGAALVKFTDAGGQAIDLLRVKFGSLLKFATETFSGISKAFEGGDLKLAAEILWKSLELIYLGGAKLLKDQVIELKVGVLTAITEMSVGAIAEASELWKGLQEVWSNITSGAKKVWANIKGDVRETFNLVRLQATKAGNAVKAALDPEFDKKAKNQEAGELFVERQNEAQGKRKSELTQIEKDRQARNKEIEEEAEARKKVIEDSLAIELATIKTAKEEDEIGRAHV